MKLSIGETLSALRRRHALTQEEVAKAVGVSAPAVSKWETGQSYPDITLLPPLARLFGVSVDDLLAYTQTLSEEALESLRESLNASFREEGWEPGLARCDALVLEYPRDAPLRMLLALAMMENAVYAGKPDQREAARARQVAWLRQAVQIGGEAETVLTAKYLLATALLAQRNTQEAGEILKQLSNLPPDVYQLMPTLRLLEEDHGEAQRLAQKNLWWTANQSVASLVTLATLAAKLGNLPLARRYQAALSALSAALEVPDSFALQRAQVALSLATAEEDHDALIAAHAEYARAPGARVQPNESPLFDRLERISPPADTAALRALLAREYETGEAYASLRQDPRFQAMMQSLQAAP